MSIAQRVADEMPDVLRDPAPFVHFRSFGDSTLNFELRIYLPHVEKLLFVRHEAHMRITEAFREAGIEIAFPQRDLHIIPQKERHDELANSIRKQMRKTATAPVETTETTTPSYDHPDAGNDDSGER